MIIVRKHPILMAIIGLAIVFALIELIFLFRYNGEYKKVKTDLKKVTKRMEQLTSREPYPSPENVEVTIGNLDTLDGYLAGLQGKLRMGQIEPEDMDPADFPNLLEQIITHLHQLAGSSGTILPEEFSTGFNKYSIQGSLPKAEDIPRLVAQLKSVARVGEIILQSRISEMVDVTREKFDAVDEKKPQAAPRQPRRRGGRGQPKPEKKPAKEESNLFSKEKFTFSFVAEEQAVLTVLNRLAKSDLFVVVKSINTQSVMPGERKTRASNVRGGSAGSASGAGAARMLSAGRGAGGATPGRRAAMTADPTPEQVGVPGDIAIELEVEVYTFKADDEEGGS